MRIPSITRTVLPLSLYLLMPSCDEGGSEGPAGFSCPSDRNSPNYLSTAIDFERVFRWTGVSGFDHVPLFIEVHDQALTDRDRHVEDIVQAREAWKSYLKSTGLRIESYTRFLSSQPPFSTNSGVIRIRFVDQIPGRLGTVGTQLRSGRLASMEMTLALRDDSGQRIDGSRARAVALHEFGHALGITGLLDGTSHSSNEADVMFPNEQCSWRSLSGGDQSAIRQLYSLAPHLVRIDG